MTTDKADHYNAQYQRQNYFAYSEGLQRQYITALVRAAKLKSGSTVLDVGCGQGLFSYLLQQQGLQVHGVDISDVGVDVARQTYGSSGATFAVADVVADQIGEKFDCVFVRGLSLYNTPSFAEDNSLTDRLLELAKPGGTFLFLYHSNCSGKASTSWLYHSWDELQRHFGKYPGARTYFSTRYETFPLGQLAFSRPVSALARLVSSLTGKGGDLICMIDKP